MNKSKIEWCDYSWNPVTGCLHGCEYCYARRITDRFSPNCKEVQAAAHHVGIGLKGLYEIEEPWAWGERTLPYPFGFDPTFHKYRLDEPARKTKGVKIFVCSMADLFGEWVPDEWIQAVFETCKKAPQHKYLFLTKNPARLDLLQLNNKLSMQENMWYGTTITREDAFMPFVSGFLFNTFVSIEPLLEEISPHSWLYNAIQNNTIKWVIIGAETGNRKGKVIPKVEWIEQIVSECEWHGIPIFMKDSLLPIVGERNMRREFPEGLKK